MKIPKPMATPSGHLVRLRGRAYQPDENKTAWAFEVHIQLGPETKDNPPIVMDFRKQAYISKIAAIKALQKSIPGISEAVAKAIGAPAPDCYIDLKAGKIVKDVNELEGMED